LTEADLLRAIIDTARWHGWMVHHDPPVTDRRGRTRTAVHGDAGFPDLVLARDGVVLIIECKSERGRFRPGQEAWLRATGGFVVRPVNLDAIIRRLVTPRTTGAGVRLTSPPAAK
jgi:hypothetical protein